MDVKSSNIIELKFPKTNSHIIKNNKGIIFCSKYKGLGRTFNKNNKKSNEFGNKVCNIVKEKLNNKGFFTSDELPDYGISKAELDSIFKKINADKKDLIVIFAYDKKQSQKTKDFLDKILSQNI